MTSRRPRAVTAASWVLVGAAILMAIPGEDFRGYWGLAFVAAVGLYLLARRIRRGGRQAQVITWLVALVVSGAELSWQFGRHFGDGWQTVVDCATVLALVSAVVLLLTPKANAWFLMHARPVNPKIWN